MTGIHSPPLPTYNFETPTMKSCQHRLLFAISITILSLAGRLIPTLAFSLSYGGASRCQNTLRAVNDDKQLMDIPDVIKTCMPLPTSRRYIMQQFAATAIAGIAQLPADAVMIDSTLSVVTPTLGDSYTQQTPEKFASSNNNAAPSKLVTAPPLSDEISFTITKSDLKHMQGGLGLELGEVSFRTNFRVVVKSVAPNSLAEKLGIQPNWVVVSVNGADAERTNASGVAIYFSRSVKSVLDSPDSANASLTLTFRDPAKFRSELQSFPKSDAVSSDENLPSVSTKVAPAGDTTQRYEDGSLRPGASITEQTDQVVTITQLIPPKMCQRRATTDDLLEISYIGTIVETGAIFDGSAVKINGEVIPGRGNDVSIFFVLGKQPFGQFPPGWDVGLQGMCVGERRRLVIPPVLAYGSTGVPRRNIPPNATLQYDITLVSLNGLATPQ